jgi:hypothetical protein
MNSEFWLTRAAKLADRAVGEPAAIASISTLVADLPQRWNAAAPVWQFGYGSCDEPSSRTATFVPLAHWTKSSWQGGPALPDERVGWVSLHADGGHPGNNPDFAAIRRWTAPVDGILAVRGVLSHASENGDGVRGRIVASSQGIVGSWPARHGEAQTAADNLHVKQGDTIDFITDCVSEVSSDSFTWRVDLTLRTEDGGEVAFHSHEDFHGPAAAATGIELASVVRAWQLAYSRLPTRDELQSACVFLTRQSTYLRLHPQQAAPGRSPELQALVSLCQALLSSNEFIYVE